jgi:hypothetical protein
MTDKLGKMGEHYLPACAVADNDELPSDLRHYYEKVVLVLWGDARIMTLLGLFDGEKPL